jgi:hypothetical protein
MKKLCKLFWNNDVLGKWILHDDETNKVLEVKKFDKDGKETHVNLLEVGMLEKGILELDHCVKIWEVELQLNEIPQIEQIPDFNETYPPLTQPIHDPFRVIGPGPNGFRTWTDSGTDRGRTFGDTTGTYGDVITYVVSGAVSENQAILSVNGSAPVSMSNLTASTKYKRQDTDYSDLGLRA